MFLVQVLLRGSSVIILQHPSGILTIEVDQDARVSGVIDSRNAISLRSL